MFNGLEFEKGILKELNNSGINTYINQKIFSHEMEFIPDILITNPIRAVVELKYLDISSGDEIGNFLSHYFGVKKNENHPPQTGFFKKHLMPVIDSFLAARSIFKEEGLICILVLISDKIPIRKTLIEQLENNIPHIKLISLVSKEKDLAKTAVKQIREILFTNARTFNPDKSKKDLNLNFSQDFRPLLDNFQAILKSDDYYTFANEIKSIDQEIIERQNICAALKIGRALEFIIFTLAKSWNIDINKPVIKIIDDLENNFSGLKNILIDYTYATETDKEAKKSKLIERINEVNRKIIELSIDLETIKPTENEKQRIPVNLNAALKEVEKKYKRIKTVRDQLNILNKEKYIKDLIELRNIAAHANINGMNKNIDDTDIKEMKKNLLTVLLHLSNINNAIVSSEGFNFNK